MPLFYVQRKMWDKYLEHKGVLVKADNWMQAKGIGKEALGEENKHNLEVNEVDVKQGVICITDHVVDLKPNK